MQYEHELNECLPYISASSSSMRICCSLFLTRFRAPTWGLNLFGLKVVMASSLSTSTLPSVVLLLERKENGFARGEGGGVRSGGEEDMGLSGRGTMGDLSK